MLNVATGRLGAFRQERVSVDMVDSQMTSRLPYRFLAARQLSYCRHSVAQDLSQNRAMQLALRLQQLLPSFSFSCVSWILRGSLGEEV